MRAVQFVPPCALLNQACAIYRLLRIPLSISDPDWHRASFVCGLRHFEPSISLSHLIHHGERLRECPLPHTYSISMTQLSFKTSQSTAMPLAALASWLSSVTTYQRQPGTSVSSPRVNTALVTRDPHSTISFPISRSREATLMARAVNRSTAQNLTVRSRPDLT